MTDDSRATSNPIVLPFKKGLDRRTVFTIICHLSSVISL